MASVLLKQVLVTAFDKGSSTSATGVRQAMTHDGLGRSSSNFALDARCPQLLAIF